VLYRADAGVSDCGAIWIVLVGRIVFAIQFLVGGAAHFKMGEQMAGYARQMGAPAPAPALGGWPAGIWLLAGGLSVAVGIWPDIGALMIAAWGIPTAWWIHAWWRYDDPDARQTQQQLFLRNVTFIGAGQHVMPGMDAGAASRFDGLVFGDEDDKEDEPDEMA